eukprot:IDg6777t1
MHVGGFNGTIALLITGDEIKILNGHAWLEHPPSSPILSSSSPPRHIETSILCKITHA